MTIYGMCRYRRSGQRYDCKTCGRPIEPEDMFFHVIYPGYLSSNYYCEACPPEGAEHARKNYRELRMRQGPKRTRRVQQ